MILALVLALMLAKEAPLPVDKLSMMSRLAQNRVEISGTVTSLEHIGNSVYLARVRASDAPEDIYDVVLQPYVAYKVRVDRYYLMSGQCTPKLTTYGSLCLPTIQRVKELK